MGFRVLSEIENIQVIAVGKAIRELARLRRMYGGRRWRKLKGYAMVALEHGRPRRVELHWHEAHGIGRKEIKIKRFIDGTR